MTEAMEVQSLRNLLQYDFLPQLRYMNCLLLGILIVLSIYALFKIYIGLKRK